jgi:hypothetical protein
MPSCDTIWTILILVTSNGLGTWEATFKKKTVFVLLSKPKTNFFDLNCQNGIYKNISVLDLAVNKMILKSAHFANV